MEGSMNSKLILSEIIFFSCLDSLMIISMHCEDLKITEKKIKIMIKININLPL